MTFTQVDYWIFLVLVLAGFALVKDLVKGRIVYLVLISFFYYYICSGFYLFLLIVSILWCFIAAQLMNRVESQRLRKTILLISSFSVAFCLGYYNWSNLIITLLNYVFHLNLNPNDYIISDLTKLSLSESGLKKIISPMGLSFFALHEISYLVDVYRKKVPKESNIFDFSLYISFFPQLISGPIIRAQDLFPQLKNITLRTDIFWKACLLILFGLVKKVCVSDYISHNVVSPIFLDPNHYGLTSIWLALFGHAFVVYCDLSGYTDIAIGIALAFGIKLPENFNFPYKATSIDDFWRRWHITIYAWLRDYVYIPLGGSQRGTFRKFINLFITFFLCAIWHGATVHVLLWGILNYIGILLTTAWRYLNIFKNNYLTFRNCSGLIITNLMFMTSGIWFKANISDGITIFKKAYLIEQTNLGWEVISQHKLALFIMAVAMFGHFMGDNLKNKISTFIQNPPLLYKVVIIATAILMVSLFSETKGAEFIYSQF